MFFRDGDGRVNLAYDADAAMPVSLSLPLEGGWDSGAPGAFLENLLPDERRARDAMALRLGLDMFTADEFDRLMSCFGKANESIEPL